MQVSKQILSVAATVWKKTKRAGGGGGDHVIRTTNHFEGPFCETRRRRNVKDDPKDAVKAKHKPQ